MRILTVCLGNICRSPTVEAALREVLAEEGLGDRVEVDSAGTGDWHIGHPPDERMVRAAADVGLVLEGSARLVTPEDLDRYDLVLVMDRSNLRDVRAMARGAEQEAKIRLFREFEDDADADDVPDPYYGGPEGFTRVVQIARAGARGVVEHLRAQGL